MNETNTLSNNEYDYIIVGQGLCGTWLSYYFLQAGRKVLVIDQPQKHTATRVASGIINPVTGRRIVRTWRIEELLPFALDAYTSLSNAISRALIQTTSVLDFHPTLQMQESFDTRVVEESEYLHTIDNTSHWKPYFNFHYSVGKVSPCLLIDLHAMQDGWRNKLVEQHALLQADFIPEDCIVQDDHVIYQNIRARKIFFCDGVAGFNNPYFFQLPYAHMKGEALIVSIPDLQTSHIYKHGLSIVPWKEGLFWIGSSYEWKYENLDPTEAFRQRATAFLQQFIKLPFTIVDHFAADRPANMERRPFVGLHPQHAAVGILNGMGTKGCSLAPFFAKQLVDHVLEGNPIYADADVKRHERILKRTFTKPV